MSLDETLMKALACPQCHGGLTPRHAPETLVCPACRLGYPVEDGIPVMLIDQARPMGD